MLMYGINLRYLKQKKAILFVEISFCMIFLLVFRLYLVFDHYETVLSFHIKY